MVSIACMRVLRTCDACLEFWQTAIKSSTKTSTYFSGDVPGVCCGREGSRDDGVGMDGVVVGEEGDEFGEVNLSMADARMSSVCGGEG